MADFRSERMPSPDGRGIARGALERAWRAYSDTVQAGVEPLLRPLVAPIARGMTFDLFGFWMSWHLLGGFEGLQTHLGMSRSAIYRKVSAFRRIMGEHPDVYQFPGVTLDPEMFMRAGASAAAEGDEDTPPQ